MRKLLVVLAFAVLWAGKSEAASVARGAKSMATVAYSLNAVNVSTGNATVLYQVILASGAASEYVAIFDSATAVGLTAAGGSSTQRFRLYYSSNSSLENRVITFDPPLQFNKGLVAINSAATGFATLIYEIGRVIAGN